MFWILRDCCQPLTQVIHLEDSEALQSSFETEIMTVFENSVSFCICNRARECSFGNLFWLTFRVYFTIDPQASV